MIVCPALLPPCQHEFATRVRQGQSVELSECGGHDLSQSASPYKDPALWGNTHLAAGHQIHISSQNIDQLAFAFVPPLRTQDDRDIGIGNMHIVPSDF